MDSDTIPTREQVKTALPTLQLLKDNLAATLQRADELRNKIAKHQAWAAPVRRVPEDVLSIMFLECSLQNWRAPLVLGAICRRWKDVMLNTPRAWALLQITPTSPPFNHQLLDLWLSRCGALKVHISLHPLAPPATVRVIRLHEQNVQCLSLFNNSKQLQHKFMELEELRLGPKDRYWAGSTSRQRQRIEAGDVIKTKDDKKKRTSLLSVKRFPKLLSLHLHSPASATMDAIARKGLFPPLQILHIHVSSPSWLRIIQHCSDTLITLVVDVASDFTEEIATEHLPTEIKLPRLKHFAYNNFSTLDGVVPFPVLKTPALECYEEANGPGGISPLHDDISSITSLVLTHPTTVNWSKAPRVAYIRLRAMPGFIAMEMEKLSANANLCPDLSTVDCVQELPMIDHRVRNTTALAMQKRSALSGKPIRLSNFVSNAEYNADPNSRLDHSMCFTYCACDAPGRNQQDIYHERCSHHEESETDSDDVSIYSDEPCPGCGEYHRHGRDSDEDNDYW